MLTTASGWPSRTSSKLFLIIAVAVGASFFSIIVNGRHMQDFLPEEEQFYEPKIFQPLKPNNETAIADNGASNYEEKFTVIPINICFVTSVYGKWASQVDRVQNLTRLLITKPSWDPARIRTSKFHFYVYTNLPGYIAPGWTKIVTKHFEYRRFITQSRWGKFLAWKDPIIQNTPCEVIFYMDSIGHIVGSPLEFEKAARDILRSSTPSHRHENGIGIAQYLHTGGGGSLGEFRRIVVYRKDLMSNIQASKDWLLAQSDFDNNCTLYENRYFGYSVNSTMFQRASQFLWDHYSLEEDSWRDQPLWCYVLVC